ncbi:3-deoxy-D-manno-octulosonate 8-phosphate phosphatase [Cytophagales bacterium WSM2-2]|nr:3-deoxy-D-manno-octulosonate 8-phosphate phosphatase [Cytophagales bacterium WSM2-2]
MDTEILFTKLGGIFCRPFDEFKGRFLKIRAYVFDWDGVFNDGVKIAEGGSPFSEVDAMGTNMLRFGHWLKNGSLPVVAVITGEENPVAQYLAQREKFHAVYFKSANKLASFEHFLKANNLKAEEVAFVYDDVLDLGVAEKCGLRLLVKHHAAPLFKNYSSKNKMADYITSSDNHAVREVCELLLGTAGNYDDAIGKRSQFDDTYQKYLNDRNKLNTIIYFQKEGKVTEGKV